MLAILGAILVGILSAGTGIKDWIELLKNTKEKKTETKIEISGDSPQTSTGENSRNIQTGGGDYIEKLEISLSIQDNSFQQQATSRQPSVRRRENVTPFLIGVVLDLSRTAFDFNISTFPKR